MEILPLFLVWVLCGFIAGAIGDRKGEFVQAFLLGILLGPVGIALAHFSQGNRKRCAACRSLIHRDATACAKCGRDQ